MAELRRRLPCHAPPLQPAPVVAEHGNELVVPPGGRLSLLLARPCPVAPLPARARTPAAAQVVAAVDPGLPVPSCVHPWMRASEGFLVVPPARPAAARSAFPSIAAAFACSPAFNSGVLTWELTLVTITAGPHCLTNHSLVLVNYN